MGAREWLPVERGHVHVRSEKVGHLEVLKWLRENDCPWDEETCMYAAGAATGVLKWARENGCPWDEETWRVREGGRSATSRC